MKGTQVKKNQDARKTKEQRSGEEIEKKHKTVDGNKARLNENKADANDTVNAQQEKAASKCNANDWCWSDTFGDWVHWSGKYRTWVYGGAKCVKKNPSDSPPTDAPTKDSDEAEGNSDADEAEGKCMQWSEKYGAWVYGEAKRVRQKDLTNKMEKNWLLGMRRNWNTEKKDKMVAKITIKRNNIDTVETHPCASNPD